MNGAASARPHSGAKLRRTDSAFASRRVYDAMRSVWMVKILPGEYYVTSDPEEMLVTILGSCVAACIRHPQSGIGGMNHFMLPQNHERGWSGDLHSTRFGNFAMEKLVNELIKAGCPRDALEIKVFGGGNVTDASNQIGTANSEFVLRYLEAEGFKCAAQDLGGKFPRRIHYSPATGKVVRRLLGRGETPLVEREEREYARNLSSAQPTGDVELFG